MPRQSLQGRIHGVSCDGGRARTSGDGRRAWFSTSNRQAATHASLFNKTASQLSGAVSLPIAGPLAAWMPPPSPHGWVNGVSRER
ncbi:hypothetical protein XspCFBP7912_05510 [Xanthomonas sp. CFBP 7912]|nr:hypothetical protein XspCFBP7912_05510 [Xanthomonas sp. CFBP 7912]